MSDRPRYDDDFYAWTQYQAAVLRSLAITDNRLDREHVAEEIEDLGKSERNAVRSEIRRILEHFLKLAHSPAGDPRADWVEIALRRHQENRATTAIPAECPYALDQILADDWYPEPPGATK